MKQHTLGISRDTVRARSRAASHSTAEDLLRRYRREHCGAESVLQELFLPLSPGSELSTLDRLTAMLVRLLLLLICLPPAEDPGREITTPGTLCGDEADSQVWRGRSEKTASDVKEIVSWFAFHPRSFFHS